MTQPSETADAPQDHRPAVATVLSPTPTAVAHATAVLRAGGLVAFPTETVYGLGADACSAVAVGRIYAAKSRPSDNPLIAHVADLATAARLVARPTALARELAERWWPGPLTLVVPALPGVPAVTRAGLDTIAIRCPDHPVARALLGTSGLALAAPSANRSGRPSPTTAAHVQHDLGDRVDLILDGGPSAVGLESTVVDATGATPVVLRDGAITREMIGLDDLGVAADDQRRRRSPGTRHRHYAPDCRVEVVAGDHLPDRAGELTSEGLAVGVIVPAGHEVRTATVLLSYRSVEHLGRELFSALRRGEDAGCDVVLVTRVDDLGLGRAVMDRLHRAGGGVL